ncbi:MAG: acetyltransferase [Rhodobacteraceae bacterium]|nr:MAG: acetyltransferase [Paracoccaceae bacterium]
MHMPDPTRRTPITLPDGSEHPGTVMLSQVIDQQNFKVGDYTYASDFDPPQDWANHLAPYLFPNGGEQLVIGRFCQIAHGARFLTAGANHAMDGLTCYPFPIFDAAQIGALQPDTRDTVIGHDVWIGYGALILPGAQIGNGAIIGAGAVVRGTIPPYAVVTGNPGKVARYRFRQAQIDQLQTLQWWHWPADQIAAARPALLSGDLDALQHLS